ncbi:PqqA peptide cyclase [Baekduia alba]|uniref:radical SAM protein n=1 Tax=Baekduia alba TaxID=2997333 RepID=UPI002340B69B|nr:radical SAM protein [Baekduia alba]WCB95400.1 PqqA peptide cyclase [Baekduia alba]
MTTVQRHTKAEDDQQQPPALHGAALEFVWLELTGKCQLQCTQCYAESGPSGTHGTMSDEDWIRVIDQAVGLGVGMVQFIGGEPMLHPALGTLVEHALDQGVAVEVYSNLVHVPKHLWTILSREGVQLATSWYTDDPGEHAQIVGRPTHRQTLANIQLAQSLGIPLRAGAIRLANDQRIEHGVNQLHTLGVSQVGVDDLRGVGRGAIGAEPDLSALCGQCANGRVAILPDGSVSPCVFSRWDQMHVGNVRRQSLTDIVAGTPLTTIRQELQNHFNTSTAPVGVCDPNGACRPNTPPPGCRPQVPSCLPDRPHPVADPAEQAPARSACEPGICGPGTRHCKPVAPTCLPDKPHPVN